MILILGVTASGKGRLAFDIASRIDAEIISIDSMKVYRRMDIGTAKPSASRRDQIKYHLLDVVEPCEAFSVDRFLDLTDESIKKITADGKKVVAVGGTAMYIKALLFGLFDGPGGDDNIRKKLKTQIALHGTADLHIKLTAVDPVAAERIHPNDARRIIRALEVYQLTGKPISSFQQQFSSAKALGDWKIIGLRRPKEIESNRINSRVKQMIEQGFVGEVNGLLAEDEPLSKQARGAIGYAEIIEHLEGEIPLEKAVENIKANTRRLAKSQRTWFKTFKDVNWLDIDDGDGPEAILQKAMAVIGE
jgi:tRNA dimethylallyltransferase